SLPQVRDPGWLDRGGRRRRPRPGARPNLDATTGFAPAAISCGPMRILRHPAVLEPADRGSVVAIGNFDGVHLGHQIVIGRTAEIARGLGARLAVLTFEPHPFQVFHPEAPPFRLTPFRANARYLEALGVDLLLVLPFDLDFSKVAAAEFVRRLIVESLHARHAVVGYD